MKSKDVAYFKLGVRKETPQMIRISKIRHVLKAKAGMHLGFVPSGCLLVEECSG